MPADPPKVVRRGKGSAKPCPICGKHRDVDLNRWLSNSYAIPAAKDDDEDAD